VKILKKRKIIELNQIDHIKSEKELLASIQHPFIVNLQESFQDDQNFYLVFDFVQGGEIFRLLRKENMFPNDVALFYIAEIILAFEHLHSQKIAYRDLKPENLLIASDGHIKITDFGFAKKIEDRSYTLCGTPEYLAPEIILQQGHNWAVDWWALGVLLFEMISGYPPFYDQNPYDIYRRIAVGYYEFANHVSVQARQLISGLLEQDLSKRLGCLNGGA
jgi:serine/threonine protein kinase